MGPKGCQSTASARLSPICKRRRNLGREHYNHREMKILNTEQMQRCDRAAIEEHGIPELVLMENAGTQVVESMDEYFGDDAPELVAVLCGKGNNGGDGLVIARHLHNQGRAVRVYLFATADELQGSTAENLRMAAAAGVDIVEILGAEAWQSHRDELAGFDCIVDALFGTGITGALRGHFGDVVAAVNANGAAVVAVDLPSGLSADSGDVVGPAVQADLTVTFAAPKWCHVFPPASEHCGELGVVDISIPQEEIDAIEDAPEVITPDECADFLEPREPDTHKGSYGRVLVVAGAPGTSGAAVLTALGALRGGAGLVSVATPETVHLAVASQLTEALVWPVAASDDAGLGAYAVNRILELAGDADVIAVGPGVGTAPETVSAIRRLIAEVSAPTVIDADGLNAFAGSVGLLATSGPPRILTPHPGEMARLLDSSTAEVQADRTGAARELAERTGATVLLKGYRTLVCAPSGTLAVNPTGNPGMATGGSGDVLTGLIAALVGQGVEATAAARVGALLHGEAGDLAAEAVGEIALIASDIVEYLPEAFQRFAPED